MVNNLLYLIGFICAIWVIVDVWTKSKKMDNTEKIIWTVCAIFFNIITAVVYYILRKK